MYQKSGANGMRYGDRVIYTIDGRHGKAGEFLQDGDADVSFDDGTFATVKWNHLIKEQKTFGVKLRVTKIKVPMWYGVGDGSIVRRSALSSDHPESIGNWIRTNLGIEPEDWMTYEQIRRP